MKTKQETRTEQKRIVVTGDQEMFGYAIRHYPNINVYVKALEDRLLAKPIVKLYIAPNPEYSKGYNLIEESPEFKGFSAGGRVERKTICLDDSMGDASHARMIQEMDRRFNQLISQYDPEKYDVIATKKRYSHVRGALK